MSETHAPISEEHRKPSREFVEKLLTDAQAPNTGDFTKDAEAFPASGITGEELIERIAQLLADALANQQKIADLAAERLDEQWKQRCLVLMGDVDKLKAGLAKEAERMRRETLEEAAQEIDGLSFPSGYYEDGGKQRWHNNGTRAAMAIRALAAQKEG